MLFKTIFNGESGNFENIRTFKLSNLKNKNSLSDWWNGTPYNSDLVAKFNKEAKNKIDLDAEDVDEAFKNLKQKYVDLAGDDKLTGTLFLNAKKGVEVTVDALDNLTPKAKAAQIALKGVAAVANMATSFAITFAIEQLISFIIDCVKASDRLKESASKLGDEFASENESINSYKKKVEELYKTINNQSSSIEETADARKQLLTLQNEMIDKFGKEAEVIDLVTQAINGQTTAFNDLSKVKWQETKNDFINNKDASWTEKLANIFMNGFGLIYSDNMERMVSEMENASVSFTLANTGAESYTNFKELIESVYGVNILNISESGSDQFTLTGDLEEVYAKLLNIQQLAEEMDIGNSLESTIGKTASNIKSDLEQYESLYNQHILFDKIFENENYEDSYDAINKAYEAYEKAFESNDSEAIESAKEAFAKIIAEATSGLKDDSVVDYFKNMYPDLQSEVATWIFEVNFKANTDNIETEVKGLLGNFNSTDKLLSYDYDTATEEQRSSHEKLEKIADDYGFLTFEDFVAFLEELGLIQSQTYQDLISRYGKENIDSLSDEDYQIAANIVLNKDKTKEEIESQLKDLEEGGNVNLRLRPQVETDKLNKKGWDAGNGTATVFTNTYSNEDGTVAMNFTPIIADPVTGEYLGVMTPEALQKYAEDVIAGVREDDFNIKIGSTFEGENAIPNAENEANIIHRLHEDLYLGFEKLEDKIAEVKKSASNIPLSFTEQMQGVNSLSKGLDQLDAIMADIIDGETFDYSSILDPEGDFANTFSGFTDEYNALIEAITNSPNDLSKSQKAFDDLATAYIISKDSLSELTEETKNATVLDLKQMGIKNAEDVVESYLEMNEAKEEAISLGYDFSNITEEEALQLEKIWTASDIAKKGLFLYEIQKAQVNNNPIDTIAECNQLINLATAAGYAGSALLYLSKIQTLLNKIDNENLVEGTYAYTAVDRKLKEYNSSLQTLLKSEIKGIGIQAEFGDGAKSLAAKQDAAADATDDLTDALEKEKEALEETKSEMEELHDAVIWFYDKQIDAIDDKIEAINEENEALEKQLENMDRVLDAIEDNYDAEIEKIQEKIDALQDENDEEERALKLEEAKRKLQEAKSRKTILQYEEGKGFVYTVDTKAIKEAEEELEGLQEEEVINQLEKEIEKLEEAKQKWLEIPEAYEKALNEMAAMNYFGSDWRTTTLFPSDELLNNFKGEYTGTQQKIDKNEERIESLEKEKEAIEELKEAWEEAINEYKYMQYEAQLATFFGSDYEFQLLNNSAIWRRKFADEYNNICAEIEALEERIKAANNDTTASTTANAEKTKQAYDTTATAVEDSVSRIKTATDGIDGGIDEVTNEMAESTHSKIEEINNFVSELNIAIGNLKTDISELMDTLSKMDEITLSSVIAAFGGGGSSTESSESSTFTTSSIGGTVSESSDGASGLLGAVQKVIDAIGSEGDSESLLGKISILNNETELTEIIDKFGSSGENGEATEGSLLSAIKFVGDAIAGEGEDSLLGKIILLCDKCETPMDLVIGDFNRLLEKITECVTKVEELSTSIASIDTSKLGGFGLFGGLFNSSGTAHTYASGSAYSSGTGKWGLSSDQPHSLVGEIGSEILVRDGKYSVIDSPTFMDLKKGDIIFNHKQTRAILQNGKKSVVDKLNEKGQAVYRKLTGSAFASGTMSSKVFDFMLKGLKLDMTPVIPNLSLNQGLKHIPNVQYNNTTVQIGDIHLHEVQNVKDFGNELIKHLPNNMLQKVRK